ncbi:MAG: hypothetical protein P8L85_22840 [Rubripirellula sp.]|nr:hypothetical protein [Rubripirellula sp.]
MNAARNLLLGSVLFVLPFAFSGCGKEENKVIEGDVSADVQANRDARMEESKGDFKPDFTPGN